MDGGREAGRQGGIERGGWWEEDKYELRVGTEGG